MKKKVTTTKTELKSALMDKQAPHWEDNLCQYACERMENFHQIMHFFFSGDFNLSHRATLIILTVSEHRPRWVQSQVPKMVTTLREDLPVWFKRNILRVLQYQNIPEGQWGHAADQCFKYLGSRNEPVAVKAFSMTVLYNLSRHLPDLGRELRLLIEEQYDLGSAGFKARGRQVLKQLEKDGY